MKLYVLAAAPVALFAASSAQAGEVIVSDVSGTPSATQWGTLPGENTGGGTAAVTTTAPRSGTASLEIRGDRTRTQLGIQYGGLTNLGALADATSLTFDWQIATDSTNPYNVDYTPALRLLIQVNPSLRRELIWEGAYNGVYGPQTEAGTWYSSSATDLFYITGGSVNEGKTIAQWAADASLAGAYVSGISVGVGSGATTGYHAFADNVTYTTTAGATTYNFDLAGAVPEPASWAMMIGGFGLVGGTMRRRQRTSVRFA